MPSDPLLIHVCCAPCLCARLVHPRHSEAMFTAFFDNPNVHPLLEYRRRLKAVQVLAERERFPLVADAGYGLETFLDAVGADRARPGRCRACYALRLDATARYAAEHGFRGFTTTLLASPQQDHEAICELGHAAAGRHGVAFDDTDCRPFYEQGMEQARRLQLYRQQYCGCIFSEHDRYRDTTEHLHPPSRGRRSPGAVPGNATAGVVGRPQRPVET